MVTVTIDGQSPGSLIHVQESTRRRRDLGQAQIVMRDTASNRNLVSPGVSVVIQRDSSKTLSGYITGKPTNSNGRLTARAMVRAGELKHLRSDRVVYDQESSVVAQNLIEKEADELDRILITTADDASNWTSEAPAAHLYSGTNAGLYRWGTDMVFLGARAGHSKTLTATYDGVTSSHVRDGIVQLETRFVIANRDDLFDAEVELRTPGGDIYLWEPEIQQGFNTYTLAGEEASTDGDLTENGTLQYRFIPRGSILQNVGVFIDHAASIPHRLVNRDTNVSIGSVDSTGRNITRRITGPVGVAINDIALEDGAEWWIDADDNWNFSTTGGDTVTDSITDGTTKVVSVDFDRDYEDISNVVTIKYAGDSSVVVRDPESIEFYGPVPKEEPIETDLENESEAIDRGRGYLQENAWNDTLGTFHIADESFGSIQAGNRISVNWSPESINGIFVADEVKSGAFAPYVVSVTISTSTG